VEEEWKKSGRRGRREDMTDEKGERRKEETGIQTAIVKM
jgi:hypothetical protein